MKLHILAISHRLPEWASLAIDDFTKRFPKDWPCQIQELKPEKNSHKVERCKIIHQEHERLLRTIPNHHILIAMDERGQHLTSIEWSKKLETWHHSGLSACFVIGGADGLHQEMRDQADMILSLSRMTVPHALARIMLVEQLYRGISILNGHPYHREG